MLAIAHLEIKISRPKSGWNILHCLGFTLSFNLFIAYRNTITSEKASLEYRNDYS